ncbi:TRAM domain-containing protein [Nanoarchaeota archaeon]
MNGRDNQAPVNEGDELEVTIEAVGEKGDGIAKVDGFVLFVPQAKQGERIKIRVTKVLKNVGFAEKIGAAETSAEEPTAEAPMEEEPAEEPARESYEDTEDFGEEPKEE